MPRNHRVNFDSLLSKKCSDDPAQRLRTPGCSVREKEFVPHSRTGTVTKYINENLVPDAPVTTTQDESTQNKPVTITQDSTQDSTQNESTQDESTQDKPVKPNEPQSNQDKPFKLALPLPRPPRDVTKFTEAMGAKGKLINVSYLLDSLIQDDIEDSDATDFESRRYKELNYLDEEYTEGVMEQAGLSEWKIDPELSTKQHLVLSKGNQTQIFFRGRAGNQDHIQGPEGLPRNKFEAFLAGEDRVGTDTRHVMDTLQNKPRDYGFIDELYKNIKEKYPSNELEVISYSNGGPKGLHMSEKYGIQHTMMDGVLGPKEVNLLKGRTNASAPLEMIRPANQPALASGMGLTKYQIMSGQTAPPNTKLTNIETYKTTDVPLMNAMEAHDGHHFSGQTDNFETMTEERVSLGKSIGTIKGAAASFLPAIAAAAIVESVAPNQNEHFKNAAIAMGTGMGSQVLAPLIGAGGASAAEMAGPLFASMEAASATSKLTDNIMKDDTSTPESVKGAISGAYAGATGGAVFVGAGAAQSAAAGAVSSALAGSGTVVAEAAGIELTGLAAAEAGLLTATEITGTLAASEGGLNPILDAAFIATALLTGGTAIAGGIIGFVQGTLHQQEIEKRKKEAAERKDAEEWRQVINKGKMREARFIAKRDSEIKLEKHRQETGYYDPKNKFKNQSTYIQSVKEDTENETDIATETETENDTENLQAA